MIRTPDQKNDILTVHVAFTGKLESMTRQEAIRKVIDLGGRASEDVREDTGYLVTGVQDESKLAGKKESSKVRKARTMLAAGLPIRIIDEQEFLRLLQDASQALAAAVTTDPVHSMAAATSAGQGQSAADSAQSTAAVVSGLPGSATAMSTAVSSAAPPPAETRLDFERIKIQRSGNVLTLLKPDDDRQMIVAQVPLLDDSDIRNSSQYSHRNLLTKVNGKLTFDLIAYDATFAQVKSLQGKVRVSISRLAYPGFLSDSAQRTYRNYVKRNDISVAQILVALDDQAGMQVLVNQRLLAAEDVDLVIDIASKARRSQMVAMLIDYKMAMGQTQTNQYDL